MPKDIRRLVFSNAEVTKAIQDYGTDQETEIPSGKVVKLTISDRESSANFFLSDKHTSFLENYNIDKKSHSAIVTFHDVTKEEQQNSYLTTNTEFITAALIDFCLRHPDIRIPKKGKKNVAKTDFNICLDIYFNVDPEDTEPDFALED